MASPSPYPPIAGPHSLASTAPRNETYSYSLERNPRDVRGTSSFRSRPYTTQERQVPYPFSPSNPCTTNYSAEVRGPRPGLRTQPLPARIPLSSHVVGASATLCFFTTARREFNRTQHQQPAAVMAQQHEMAALEAMAVRGVVAGGTVPHWSLILEPDANDEKCCLLIGGGSGHPRRLNAVLWLLALTLASYLAAMKRLH